MFALLAGGGPRDHRCIGRPETGHGTKLYVAAKRGIRAALAAHLDALSALGRESQPKAEVSVLRRDVYQATGHPLAARAARDLDEYLGAEPTQFERGLLPTLAP